MKVPIFSFIFKPFSSLWWFAGLSQVDVVHFSPIYPFILLFYLFKFSFYHYNFFLLRILMLTMRKWFFKNIMSRFITHHLMNFWRTFPKCLPFIVNQGLTNWLIVLEFLILYLDQLWDLLLKIYFRKFYAMCSNSSIK